MFRFAHPGAVYLHLGRSYLVKHLDLEARTVLVDDFDGTYYTQVKTDKNVRVAGRAGLRSLPGATLFFGEIEVTEQVIAYQRRDLTDQHIIDTTTLDLPEQTFTTQAFWLAVPAATMEEALAELARARAAAAAGPAAAGGTTTAGAAGGGRPGGGRRPGRPRQPARRRARAHRSASAVCHVRPLGHRRPRMPWHWQTDAATIFVYDGYPGGIGLTRRGYEAFESLAADARTLIAECPLRVRLPELRAEPQMRQPQRTAQQGRCRGAVRGDRGRRRHGQARLLGSLILGASRSLRITACA